MNKAKAYIIPFLCLLAPALFSFIYFVLLPDHVAGKLLYYTSKIFLISFPILWTLFGEKKKFPRPRFSGKGIRVGLLSGLAIGLTAMVLYIHVLANVLPVDEVQLKAAQLGFAGKTFILFALFVIIANSTLEEYYWRWFGFTQLKKVFPSGRAILLSGIGFALHHVVILVTFFGWGPGLLFGFCTAVGGWIWCWFYDRYDSIWPSWISHALVDAGLMFIGFDMLFCR